MLQAASKSESLAGPGLPVVAIYVLVAVICILFIMPGEAATAGTVGMEVIETVNVEAASTAQLNVAGNAGVEAAGNGEAATAGNVEAEATGNVRAEAASGEVWVVPVQGTIELGLAEFLQRVIDEAGDAGATAILLELNTFGGRVDAATEIRDAIMASPVPVLAYVTERAWSAGALIALAARHLAMAPGSSIGAAEPRPAEEKVISALRAEFEATAQGQGRDPQVAAAMVDKDVSVPGLVEAGKILTLSADKAAEIGFIDLIAGSRRQVLDHFGYGAARVREMQPTWAEILARFLTDPVVSSLLLTAGFVGLVIEMLTPGWGLPGAIGIVALALFFGGRIVVGLASWGIALLFIIGLILLIIEVFVIPGFGVAGVAGLLAVFGSVIFSFASAQAGLISLLIALGLTAVIVTASYRYIRKTRAWNRLILTTAQKKDAGYVAPTSYADYLGKTGKALTPLRPAGTITIGEMRLDAVTEGGFIPAQTPVRVVRVEGNRIFVRAIEEGTE